MLNFCLLLGALLLTPLPAAAQTTDETETPVVAVQVEEDDAAAEPPDLADLLWVARPLVVFADTPNDPRYLQQLGMLEERADELDSRNVVILTDTDPASSGPLRMQLRPRGFGVVLIDTDGSVVRRHPAPVSARELINQIDRLPSRRQETNSLRQ